MNSTVKENEKSMPSEIWLSQMQPGVVASMCDDNDDMRTCFKDITREGCEKIASAAVDACARFMQKDMPETIGSKNAYQYGGLLGVCSAKVYVRNNKEKLLVEKPGCNKYIPE